MTSVRIAQLPSLTLNNLLVTQGGLYVVLDSSALLGINSFLFDISDNDFRFKMIIDQAHLIVQRNRFLDSIDLNTLPVSKNVLISIVWTLHDTRFGYQILDEGGHKEEKVIKTGPILPPSTLFRWARKQTLMPTDEYDNAVQLLNKVISCLMSVQDKIRETDSYSIFWNTVYDGNKIEERWPKKEVDIHPYVHALLSDQALISSFEVIPEYPTGVGDLDFRLLGKLKGSGFGNVFIECKNAHSEDLEKGLLQQLPAYMQAQNIDYGIYCVFDYYGHWLDKLQGIRAYVSETELKLIQLEEISKNPIQRNIIIYYLKLSKPLTATKG